MVVPLELQVYQGSDMSWRVAGFLATGRLDLSAYWQDMDMGRRVPAFDEAVIQGHQRVRRHLDMRRVWRRLTALLRGFQGISYIIAPV